MPNSSSWHGRLGHDQVNARFPRFTPGGTPVPRKVPFSGEARRREDSRRQQHSESSRLLAFVVRFFWLAAVLRRELCGPPSRELHEFSLSSRGLRRWY